MAYAISTGFTSHLRLPSSAQRPSTSPTLRPSNEPQAAARPLVQRYNPTPPPPKRHPLAYSIHLPSSYSANTSNPLVLGLHRSSEDPPRRPQRRRRRMGRCLLEATFPEDLQCVSDLQFVSDLLDEIRTGCLPSAAAFHTIACAPVYGNFAPFTAGSGSFYTDNGGVSSLTDACALTPTPLPVLEIHGGSDMDGPYAGGAGEGGTAGRSLLLLIGRWVTCNGCTGRNNRDARQRGRAPLSLNPIFISYHSTLLPLLVPCVSLRPTLSALPILLRILVPTLLTCTSHDGPSFYHCLPSFIPPSCFPILSAPPMPPPISPSHCWASPSLNSFEISVGHGRTTFNASTIVMAVCETLVV
ncbi:hypothetical protein B0H14DRAFT_3568784 [Mycena olivaceomarginata]|nr:hypothetical protein B0H14DRAFT_3568784 [Mycena olivaceomarginata]